MCEKAIKKFIEKQLKDTPDCIELNQYFNKEFGTHYSPIAMMVDVLDLVELADSIGMDIVCRKITRVKLKEGK